MKLFTKTVSLTFTVEHTSDDPEYESRLADAVSQAADDALGYARSQFAHELTSLIDPIVAGGWGVDIKEDT